MLKLLLFSQLWHAFPDLLIAASMFQIMLSCFGLFSGEFEGNKNLTSDFAQVNKKNMANVPYLHRAYGIVYF